MNNGWLTCNVHFQRTGHRFQFKAVSSRRRSVGCEDLSTQADVVRHDAIGANLQQPHHLSAIIDRPVLYGLPEAVGRHDQLIRVREAGDHRHLVLEANRRVRTGEADGEERGEAEKQASEMTRSCARGEWGMGSERGGAGEADLSVSPIVATIFTVGWSSRKVSMPPPSAVVVATCTRSWQPISSTSAARGRAIGSPSFMSMLKTALGSRVSASRSVGAYLPARCASIQATRSRRHEGCGGSEAEGRWLWGAPRGTGKAGDFSQESAPEGKTASFAL